jgi:diadenosine tetraphosphate (Ap4A) HIT family hydrolase
MSNLPPSDCPFCSIPADRLRETSAKGFVVDDAYPVSLGHSLVIAKRHVENFFELTNEEIACLVNLLHAVRERLDKSLMPAGYNIGVNLGMAAGQTVMHVHIHLIPRYPGDVPNPRGGVRNLMPGKGGY